MLTCVIYFKICLKVTYSCICATVRINHRNLEYANWAIWIFYKAGIKGCSFFCSSFWILAKSIDAAVGTPRGSVNRSCSNCIIWSASTKKKTKQNKTTQTNHTNNTRRVQTATTSYSMPFIPVSQISLIGHHERQGYQGRQGVRVFSAAIATILFKKLKIKNHHHFCHSRFTSSNTTQCSSYKTHYTNKITPDL